MNNDALNGVVEVLKAGNGLTRSYVVSQVASRGGQVFATVTGGIGSFSIDVTSDMLRGKSLESAVETRITSYSLAYAAGMLSAYVVGSVLVPSVGTPQYFEALPESPSRMSVD